MIIDETWNEKEFNFHSKLKLVMFFFCSGNTLEKYMKLIVSFFESGFLKFFFCCCCFRCYWIIKFKLILLEFTNSNRNKFWVKFRNEEFKKKLIWIWCCKTYMFVVWLPGVNRFSFLIFDFLKISNGRCYIEK